MKKEDIMPGDWYRILFGETPEIFLVETLLRTIIIYAILLLIVRLMGKRMGGQLTISELAVMITLGAIVSPGMQMPQTGLLLCTVILVCALSFQRGINYWEFKSKTFEQLSQGTLSVLVRNGVMQLDEMKQTKVSRQQLFAALRNQEVRNLGDVERVYLESCGLFSIYKAQKPKPGLPLFPPDDKNVQGYQQKLLHGDAVCANCGTVQATAETKQNCPACGADQWGEASITNSMLTSSQS